MYKRQHIGIEVDSLFRHDKVFIRNRVDCFVGYAVIFIAVFTIAGAMVGKGNHQCVGTLLKDVYKRQDIPFSSS